MLLGQSPGPFTTQAELDEKLLRLTSVFLLDSRSSSRSSTRHGALLLRLWFWFWLWLWLWIRQRLSERFGTTFKGFPKGFA